MNPEQLLNSRSRTDSEAKGGITNDLEKKTTPKQFLTLILETCSEVTCSQHC